MNYAIVLSGGVGTRLGLTLPKQYYVVHGKPILQYVIQTIESCQAIDGFVVVAAEEWREYIHRLIGNEVKFLGFADPGENRQLSIYQGILALGDYAKDEDRVLVQDAARPNTSEAVIRGCLSFMDEYDGAMPVLPMKDTIYISKSGKEIEQLMNRQELFAGQAPEGFVYGKYRRANERLLPDEILRINGASEPAILAGMRIAMFPGDENNYKITTEADLLRFVQQIEDKGRNESTRIRRN